MKSSKKQTTEKAELQKPTDEKLMRAEDLDKKLAEFKAKALAIGYHPSKQSMEAIKAKYGKTAFADILRDSDEHVAATDDTIAAETDKLALPPSMSVEEYEELRGFFHDLEQSFFNKHKNYLQLLGSLYYDNELDKNSYSLNKEYIRDQVKELFSTASKSVFETPEEFQEFVRNTVAEFLPSEDDTRSSSLPDKAPEHYKERENRKEKPEEFLRRVYEPWLFSRGLFASHIGAWDLSLYQALYRRRDHIVDFDKMLPKAPGKSVGDLARSEKELLEARRVSRRKSDRKRYKPVNGS